MRQFLAPALPDTKGHLTISGKDFRYLHQVLRLKLGDSIQVRLPSGLLQAMAVTALSSDRLRLTCCAGDETKETGVTASQIEAWLQEKSSSLWLFQFMTKAQKMDGILRQATEIGVTKIVPVVGRHCQKDAAFERMERWQRVIREARQQSGSPVETHIEKPCNLQEAMGLWQQEKDGRSCGVVLYERSQDTRSFHQAVSTVTKSHNLSVAALVSGCEGGFAPEEIEMLKENGFTPVHLDTNILRAETASVYGLAVLQNLLTERPQWQLSESNF